MAEESKEPSGENQKKVTLVSQESEKFEVDLDVALMSELVKTMFDDESAGEIQEIPLPNVSSSTLTQVIAFCTQHVKVEKMTEIEKPIKSV